MKLERAARAAFTPLCAVTLAATSAVPLVNAAAAVSGYEVELTRAPLLAAVTAAQYAFLLCLSAYVRFRSWSLPSSVLPALMPPLAVINALFYVPHSGEAAVPASVFLSVVSAFALAALCGRPGAFRAVGVGAGALLLPPVLLAGFVSTVFSGFGNNTVVMSLPSPGGAYTAEVIDSDQGALGGDTLVTVRKTSGFDAAVFRFSASPRRVYTGEWGEYEDMEIYWRDEGTLIINSREYKVLPAG